MGQERRRANNMLGIFPGISALPGHFHIHIITVMGEVDDVIKVHGGWPVR